jgi:hypothetical protein
MATKKAAKKAAAKKAPAKKAAGKKKAPPGPRGRRRHTDPKDTVG